MNARNLIEILKSLPANTKVLVQGYEDGYDDIKSVRRTSVRKLSKAKDWSGEYEEITGSSQSARTVIVLIGNRR